MAAEGLHAQAKTSGHLYSLCVFHGSGHPGLLDAYPFLWLLSTTLLTQEGGWEAGLELLPRRTGPLRNPGVSLLSAPERIQPGETQARGRKQD